MRSIQPNGPINPDPLGQLTDELASIVGAMLPPDKQPLAEQLARVLSTWAAEVIGRAASQSASVSVATLHRVEDIERRERARGDRIFEIERTVNGRVDALHAEVEQLRERQAGDGSAE